jgi:hypothetical protein
MKTPTGLIEGLKNYIESLKNEHNRWGLQPIEKTIEDYKKQIEEIERKVRLLEIERNEREGLITEHQRFVDYLESLEGKTNELQHHETN